MIESKFLFRKVQQILEQWMIQVRYRNHKSLLLHFAYVHCKMPFRNIRHCRSNPLFCRESSLQLLLCICYSCQVDSHLCMILEQGSRDSGLNCLLKWISKDLLWYLFMCLALNECCMCVCVCVCVSIYRNFVKDWIMDK